MKGRFYIAYENCFPVSTGTLTKVEQAIKLAKRVWKRDNSLAYKRSFSVTYRKVKVK